LRLLVKTFKMLKMADDVVECVLQMRKDRGTQVPNAGDDSDLGSVTVEEATSYEQDVRDDVESDSRIDNSHQVSSVNVSAVVKPTHPLDCRDWIQ
jgi:hypothetical protein